MGMHESKSRRVEEIHKEAKPEKESQILAEMPRLTNPRKVFRRYQDKKTVQESEVRGFADKKKMRMT